MERIYVSLILHPSRKISDYTACVLSRSARVIGWLCAIHEKKFMLKNAHSCPKILGFEGLFLMGKARRYMTPWIDIEGVSLWGSVRVCMGCARAREASSKKGIEKITVTHSINCVWRRRDPDETRHVTWHWYIGLINWAKPGVDRLRGFLFCGGRKRHIK